MPIGEKQTISQSYVVVVITEALQLTSKERLLEIGSGSGYQAAILAELSAKVFSIDGIRSLAPIAGKLLYDLGYFNVARILTGLTEGTLEENETERDPSDCGGGTRIPPPVLSPCQPSPGVPGLLILSRRLLARRF